MRYATIVDGVLVPGELIDPPAAYDPVTALGSKLKAYWYPTGATHSPSLITRFSRGRILSPATPCRRRSHAASLHLDRTGWGPAISFDSTQYLTCTDAGLLAALPDGAEPSEIWVVVSQDALPANTTERYAVAYGGASLTTGRAVSRVVTSGTNRARSRTGTGGAATSVNDTAVISRVVHVIRQEIGATSTSLEVDGATPTSAAAVPATTNSRLRAGSISASGPSNHWKPNDRAHTCDRAAV